MSSIIKSLAFIGLLVSSAAANAWWGPWNQGWNGGPFAGVGGGEISGDFDFSMGARSKMRAYGQKHGYGQPYYGAPYGNSYPGYYGKPTAPAEAAPDVPTAK